MNRPSLPCRHCLGRGIVPLARHLWKTLSVIEKIQPATAESIHAVFKTLKTINSFNNRLEELRELGFLERIRSGKYWLYSVKKEG